MDNIKLIQDTAVEAAGKRLIYDGDQPELVILDKDQTVHSLEKFALGRNRFRGVLSTSSIDDFASYVSSQKSPANATGFVDVNTMAASVFFNLGTQQEPGHGDWQASLRLLQTAAFRALHAIDGVKLDQTKMTEWLEDWSDELVAEFPSDASGEPSLVRAIAALRKMKISTKAETTSNVGDFASNRSAMEDVEARSADLLPLGFRMQTVPYDGLSSRAFSLRLSVLTGGEKPILVLRWQRKEAALEAIAREFKGVLGDKLGEGVPLTIGTFDLSK